MTKEFDAVLRMLGAAVNGIDYTAPEGLDTELIRNFAIAQDIWTLIFPVAEKSMDLSKYKKEYLSLLFTCSARVDRNLNAVKKMQDAGLKPCILKGVTLAELYPIPEARISGDMDVLVTTDEEAKAFEILRKCGYNITDRGKYSHHSEALHPSGAMLELHVMMYDKATDMALFNNELEYNEERREIEINGGKYMALGINDGLMYTFAHYVKHYTQGGGGIRHMTDLLLYIEKYRDKIDFNAFSETIKRLRYDKLFTVIETIGAKYFGFDYELKYEELAVRMLEITEENGIFGHATGKYIDRFSLFCKSRIGSDNKEGQKFFKENRKSIAERLFPNKEDMLFYGYPLAKSNITLPIAWTQKWFKAFKKRIIKDKNKKLDSWLEITHEMGMMDDIRH